ncbi:MAG: iron ABC transporter permease [Bacteroidota bacterium]
MYAPSQYYRPFFLLIIALALAWALNLVLGSVVIPLKDIGSILMGGQAREASWYYIIWNYRIPKSITAIFVGGGLSLGGLLMQTYFRNPLAGPFVLGISSGASLGAALLFMGSAAFGISILSDISVVAAASMGSFLVLFIIIITASHVRDTMALLIIGLMFGSITGALVSILAYFSSAEQLQRFIFWSFGSVGNLSTQQNAILGGVVGLGLVLSFLLVKPLNALLLGENYAKSMGVSLQRSRAIILITTGLLAGTITAFAGPIAFVGLAVPHLARQFFSTMEHKVLVPAVFLLGAVLMLCCDTVAQLPSMARVLPINAITSILGAPMVIWLLLRQRKLLF